MSSDVIVSHVSFSSQELGLRLSQRWRFLSIDRGEVCIHGEPVAEIDKRGATVRLAPIGAREPARWVAWAIQEISFEAEAYDDDMPIREEPMTPEAVEEAVHDAVAARQAAIAREADPSGGAQEAVTLVTYLVKRGLLELSGSTAIVARAVVPVLKNVDESLGARLEDVLLDLDEVDELFADADELTKLIQNNDHIFDRGR